MKEFSGFPARMEFTAIPNLFFSSLLPQINDIIELKTILHFFQLLYRKRGYPRFVTYQELLENKSLVTSLRQQGTKPPDEVLRQVLEEATRQEIILHLVLDKDGVTEDIYFLNTESQREIVARIKAGALTLKGLKASAQTDIETEEASDIFTLYEQNIGMLTPLIAEELQEAEKLYPVSWIKDAIQEAVSLNKRNWRYITRILESWSAQGKSDGTHKRYFKKADPDKYIRGKYGHMVKR